MNVGRRLCFGLRWSCFWMLAAVAPGVAGCGGDGAPMTTCPNDLPPSCVQPSPTYQADTQAIIMQRCFPCHGSGGVALPARDFTSYDKIQPQASAILNQVYACKMPPAGAPTPTAGERATLLHWLVCNAPP